MTHRRGRHHVHSGRYVTGESGTETHFDTTHTVHYHPKQLSAFVTVTTEET